MPDFFSFINSVLWGSVMIYLLFGAGCWFTFRTGFVQFRNVSATADKTVIARRDCFGFLTLR